MRRIYRADAAAAPPAAPASPSVGYPSVGDPINDIEPTLIGQFWFHMVTEAIVTVIEHAGETPDDTPTQFRDALISLIPGSTDLSSYATQAWVAEQLADYLLESGGTMTGALNLVTPPAEDNSKKAVNSEWVRRLLMEAAGVVLATVSSGRLGGEINLSSAMTGYRWLRFHTEGVNVTKRAATEGGSDVRGWQVATELVPVGRIPARPAASNRALWFGRRQGQSAGATIFEIDLVAGGGQQLSDQFADANFSPGGFGAAWHQGDAMVAYSTLPNVDPRFFAVDRLDVSFPQPVPAKTAALARLVRGTADFGTHQEPTAVALLSHAGELYLFAGRDSTLVMFRVDLQRLRFERLGPVTLPAGATLDALGAESDGATIFLALRAPSNRYRMATLALNTRIATWLAHAGQSFINSSSGDAAGLAWDGATLYAMLDDDGTSEDVYSVNRVTGEFTRLHETGLLAHFGLGFVIARHYAGGLKVGHARVWRVDDDTLFAASAPEDVGRIAQVVGIK